MKKTLVMAAAAVLTGSMAYPSLAEEYVFEMAPVVVTANRMNENLVDARADISVVTSRQIEKLHLNTVEDALRTVPGTQYLNYGGNGLNANLSGIRINGSKDIILLVDGVRVTDFNGANNSGYMYSSLLNNMDNVERIEVLRGSAGALYGSGAKGGVINIITKNPGEKKTTVDIARGTGGREIYKLTTMGRVGKFSYMAYYDKLLIGDTKSGDGRLWPGHTHTLSDGVKFAYDFTDKHSLSLSYDKMKSRYRGYDFVYSNRYHGDYKSDKAITIDHYSGNTTVNFGTLTQNGNGVTISAAAANSAITMSGDRGGLSETEAMGRLAGKLTYTAYTNGERNLNGTVKLNEGLTARSVARTGRINFNSATGKGSLGKLFRGSLIMKMMAAPSASVTSGVSAADGMTLAALPGGGEALYSSGMAYILGDRETMMMRGAKSAMTTSMLSWRSGMTDMNQRLGDLRLGASSGMWARTYGGKVKYDKDKTNLSNSFWGAQVGADHKLGSGWHIGGAFDYNDGNAKYDFGGKGDPKLYVGSIYGTKVFDDGQYVDIVGKIGRAENDYTVYNAEGRKLDGDYHATGYGLSVEYGKRFGTATGYVEPQIQLLFSRLGSADYDAASDFDGDKKMHVHQDSMSSFIGRLGIAAGRATEKGNLYAKASILHEFKGDTAATFSAEGEDTSRVEQDFGDTWAELTLGGVYRLNGSNLFYANVTRGFGGDYKVEWKVNAGLRFAF